MENDAVKICPFCKEQIRREAVKCRYCGEWLKEQAKNFTVKTPGVHSTPKIVQVLPRPDVAPQPGSYMSGALAIKPEAQVQSMLNQTATTSAPAPPPAPVAL